MHEIYGNTEEETAERIHVEIGQILKGLKCRTHLFEYYFGYHYHKTPCLNNFVKVKGANGPS